MKHTFKIENKIISIKKDCKRCLMQKTCKYHAKMKALCQSNEFYEMTEYLEWNNSLGAFEEHSSCQYYKLKYDIPKDGSVSMDVERGIIDEIISIELHKCFENITQWSKNCGDGIVSVSTTEGKHTIKISDLINGYKFK